MVLGKFSVKFMRKVDPKCKANGAKTDIYNQCLYEAGDLAYIYVKIGTVPLLCWFFAAPL